MKSVDLSELHRRTGAVVEEAAHGEVIVIEKRGIPIAEIRPPQRKAAGFPPDHWTFLKRFPEMPDDSGSLISESRDRGCSP
ncbi:MAG TPA: type II toxin-antitoxin system prevent-host-death family antitoxin [Bryobacteraceae bacterium]|jgi:prevent-host-death family protein